MSARHARNRLSTWLVAGLVALPPVVAFAAGPEQTGQAAPEGRQDAQAAILHGRVTNEKGAPLADVRVRVAIPAADMRHVDATTGHTLLEARSDAKGHYRLELPKVTKRTTVSIDAMKPGYQRLVGTLMRGGDARRVEVAPGKEAEADLRLEPARYLAGIVYNEQGKPIPGVQIAAHAVSVRSTGGVERTASNPDGSFELFNYPVKLEAIPNEATEGVVTFSHPGYTDLKFKDVYALEPDQLAALRIVLESGHKVTGTVLDVAGKPVPNAMVKAMTEAAGEGTMDRKATLTDANGKFALRGLNGGLTKLTARSLAIKQKIELPLTLDGDKTDLEVRLQRISLPADLKTHDVLGMKLADVTPELKSAYDLYQGQGALILDPGKDSERLKIGELAEGYLFWMVGNKRVGGVREFVNQVLAETAGQDAGVHSVRVVYSYSTVEGDGNNTQYLKLTNDDLKRLKVVSDRLKEDSR